MRFVKRLLPLRLHGDQLTMLIELEKHTWLSCVVGVGPRPRDKHRAHGGVRLIKGDVRLIEHRFHIL